MNEVTTPKKKTALPPNVNYQVTNSWSGKVPEKHKAPTLGWASIEIDTNEFEEPQTDGIDTDEFEEPRTDGIDTDEFEEPQTDGIEDTVEESYPPAQEVRDGYEVSLLSVSPWQHLSTDPSSGHGHRDDPHPPRPPQTH